MRGVSRPFSAASVLLFTLLVASHAATVTVPYSVKAEGQVSLAIYDQQGRLVRTLLTGAPRRPGQYVEVWDGCDRYGNPQPPARTLGSYSKQKGWSPSFSCRSGRTHGRRARAAWATTVRPAVLWRMNRAFILPAPPKARIPLARPIEQAATSGPRIRRRATGERTGAWRWRCSMANSTS